MGGKNVPTFSSHKETLKKLDHIMGIDVTQERVVGTFGNVFYTNSVADFIRKVRRFFCSTFDIVFSDGIYAHQEWTNPHLRPHLRLYPRQGAGLKIFLDGQLFSRLPHDITSPMVILQPKGDRVRHAYIGELVQLYTGSILFVKRWYEFGGQGLRGEGLIVKRVRGEEEEEDTFVVSRETDMFGVSEISSAGQEVDLLGLSICQLFHFMKFLLRR